jgi:hypothetical protein
VDSLGWGVIELDLGELRRPRTGTSTGWLDDSSQGSVDLLMPPPRAPVSSDPQS